MKNICHNFYRKIIFNASALSPYKVTLGCLQSDYCPVTTGQLPECINNDKSLH